MEVAGRGAGTLIWIIGGLVVPCPVSRTLEHKRPTYSETFHCLQPTLQVRSGSLQEPSGEGKSPGMSELLHGSVWSRHLLSSPITYCPILPSQSGPVTYCPILPSNHPQGFPLRSRTVTNIVTSGSRWVPDPKDLGCSPGHESSRPCPPASVDEEPSQRVSSCPRRLPSKQDK